MGKWQALFTLSVIAACAATEDPPTSSTPDAAANSDARTDAKASDGGATPGLDAADEDAAIEGDASKTDATANDASTDAAATDAAANDGASSDTGVNDAGSDTSTTNDAGDAGCPVAPSACVPPGGNVAACGAATATSTYSGYSPSALVDDVLTTSWYASTGACPAGVCPGTSVSIDVELDTPRTIKRVELYGNRDGYPTDYDVLTARVQLLGEADAVLATQDVTTSRGSEPNGDATVTLATALTCVRKIRVIVLTGEATYDEPGFAEIRAFSQ